jgi:hypothetical protein
MILLQFQALSSGLFQRGLDRINLHRPTLVASEALDVQIFPLEAGPGQMRHTRRVTKCYKVRQGNKGLHASGGGRDGILSFHSISFHFIPFNSI